MTKGEAQSKLLTYSANHLPAWQYDETRDEWWDRLIAYIEDVGRYAESLGFVDEGPDKPMRWAGVEA
jgi:hypothetical protein